MLSMRSDIGVVPEVSSQDSDTERRDTPRDRSCSIVVAMCATDLKARSNFQTAKMSKLLLPSPVYLAANLPLRAVLFSAFSGLRWSEQTAVRIEEEVHLKANRLHITRSLYKRVPQVPKTRQSVRRVVMTPIVRRILETVPWKEGYVFSKAGDGMIPLMSGNWLKEQWRQAQVDAGVRHPIRCHDLRHQFVSMLIAIGKSPKYIAEQVGHASAGFTFDRYGHLFETITPAPAEWPEDLLWPGGCHAIVTLITSNSRRETGERTVVGQVKTLAGQGPQRHPEISGVNR
jgi:hypothetical protein